MNKFNMKGLLVATFWERFYKVKLNLTAEEYKWVHEICHPNLIQSSFAPTVWPCFIDPLLSFTRIQIKIFC